MACGRAEAYLEKSSKPWDDTAGSIILTEAGGEISDWSGEEVPYLQNSDVLYRPCHLMDPFPGLTAKKEKGAVSLRYEQGCGSYHMRRSCSE
ncbi:MAG TPA: hypothetical protein DDW86_07105 [Clostridiales bacterium]|nr:hypothetical protein [Clostridiales bacterium]